MTGLGIANQSQEFADVFSRLPHTLAADPRFAKHQGRLHQEAGRWSNAAHSYQRPGITSPITPSDIVFAAHSSSPARLKKPRTGTGSSWTTAAQFKEVRGIAGQVNAALNEGRIPEPGLCQHIANLRERMGRVEEARAWQQLAPDKWPALLPRAKPTNSLSPAGRALYDEHARR